jgi:5-methylcytosine-specific restriction endonuclease McrA
VIKIPRGKYPRTKKHNKILSDNAKKRYIKNPEIKEAVFKRDNYQCQMCRDKFTPDHLVLYYLTPKGNPTIEIENILTLCPGCEIIAYKGSIWGYAKNGKPMIDRWNKEDILNMWLCRKMINNQLDS